MSESTPAPATIAVNGLVIRELRMLQGMRVRELAAKAGVGRSYITRLETGDRTRVSPWVFNGIVNGLGVADRRSLMAADTTGIAA